MLFIEKRKNNLRKKIKALRIASELTCENMAHDLEISTASYHKMETGKSKLSLDRLLRICEILKISPSELFSSLAIDNQKQKNTQESELTEMLELYRKNESLSKKLIENLEQKLITLDKKKAD